MTNIRPLKLPTSYGLYLRRAVLDFRSGLADNKQHVPA
jgi:hypothetical protein